MSACNSAPKTPTTIYLTPPNTVSPAEGTRFKVLSVQSTPTTATRTTISYVPTDGSDDYDSVSTSQREKKNIDQGMTYQISEFVYIYPTVGEETLR